MIAVQAHECLRSALRAELNRRYGRIGEIEQGLDRAEGYLSKYCRGELSIPVDVFLKSLELLGVEPGQFFCNALGSPPDSSVLLRNIMATEPDKSLSKLQAAAIAVAHEVPDLDPTDLSGGGSSAKPEACPSAVALAEAMVDCTALEQRRRLRSTQKYRTAAFARAYLAKVIALSYRDPKTAVKQAEVVGVDLVPKIEDCSAREKLELILTSISAWAFANQIAAAFPQAAAGAFFGLVLASAHRLDRLKAELLRVGAYVLSAYGEFRSALQLLGDAMIAFDDLEDQVEVAKVQVQRGGNYLDLGEYGKAVMVLKKALRCLPQDASTQVYRLAVFQRLARASELVGDLERAEAWLQEALLTLPDERSVNAAKLLWQAARLNMQRSAFDCAEANLEKAIDILFECQASECTLVALDLVRTLLALNKVQKAVELARGMARLITSSRHSPFDQAALSEFVRAAIEGELTIAMVDRLENRLKDARA